jgi:hypothetical protein
MRKALLASMAAATLAAGVFGFAAAPASAAPACRGYPFYCETVKYDTPVYGTADGDFVQYTAHAGDAVDVNIDSCSHGRIWGADDSIGGTTGYFPNDALSFSPCYLIA